MRAAIVLSLVISISGCEQVAPSQRVYDRVARTEGDLLSYAADNYAAFSSGLGVGEDCTVFRANGSEIPARTFIIQSPCPVRPGDLPLECMERLPLVIQAEVPISRTGREGDVVVFFRPFKDETDCGSDLAYLMAFDFDDVSAASASDLISSVDVDVTPYEVGQFWPREPEPF
jgi:hypothetical protein